MARQKSDYALMWANGKTFGEIYDLMEADIRSGANWDGTAKKILVGWGDLTDDEVFAWVGGDDDGDAG